MEEDTGSLSSTAINAQLKDLTAVVTNLSRKLDDFVENNSLYSRSLHGSASGWGAHPGSPNGPEMPYGSLNGVKRMKRVEASSDENKERGNWSTKVDFILSILGYAVGLGNIWRFPTQVFASGGGAFFIPYLLMLLFAGIPIFFLELALGQFSSSGPLTCWKFSPIFQGIGWAMLIVSAVTGTYYNVIFAWSIYYFGLSFTSHLPWQDCDREWNTQYCYDRIPDTNCTELAGLYAHPNGTCHNVTANYSLVGLWNVSLARDNGIVRQSAPEQFYNNYILGVDKSPGVHDLGGIRWQLVVSLLASWVIVFLCLCKGVKSVGKAVYFTALYPYVILLALLINAFTLDGYQEGIRLYLTPDWDKLADAKVWNDAGVQIFFSLGVGFGGLLALSSYNRFHNNCLRDALIVSIGNCLTSFFAGFVVFSYLGILAKYTNTDVKNVVQSGFGLVFVVYPDAITRMPGFTPAWAVFFFLMLITLGLDTQFANIEAVVTSLADRWPHTFTQRRKPFVVFCLCSVFFLCGLIFCTDGGIYVLELLNAYVGGWSVMMIGLGECFALMWVYGWGRFSKDIEIMLGYKTPFCRGLCWGFLSPWRVCWTALSPIIILYILFFAWTSYGPLTYGPYVFPQYATIISWICPVVVVLPIPVFAILTVLCWSGEGSLGKKFARSLRPTPDWGPALVEHRRLVTYVPGFILDPKGSGHRSSNSAQTNNQNPTSQENEDRL